MNRTHSCSLGATSLVATGSLVATLVLGCGPSSQKAGPVPLANTSEAAAVVPAAPKGLFNKAADAQRLLPPGAEAYFGADIRALRSAAVLDKYEEMIGRELPTEAARLKSECGLDLMSDFDWSLGAFSFESEVFLFIIKGNFTKAQVEECLVKIDPSIKITTEGDLSVYTADGEDLLMAWPSDSVVMIADAKSRARLEAAAARASATEVDPGVTRNLGNVDTNAAIWFTIEPTANMTSGMPVKELNAVRMTIEASSTLDLIIAAEFGSSAKAAEAHTLLGGGIDMVKAQSMSQPFRPIVDKLRIAHTDRVVSGNLNLTEDDLATLEDMAKMFGMGLGGNSAPPAPPLP